MLILHTGAFGFLPLFHLVQNRVGYPDFTDYLFKLLRRNPAGTKQHRSIAGNGYHSRLNANLAHLADRAVYARWEGGRLRW